MKSIANATLLFITCLLLTSATVQTKQQVYLQLVDPAGQPIRGTSVDRGYERQIIATAFSGYTAGNSQLRFSMPSGSATAALANLQGSGQKPLLRYSPLRNPAKQDPMLSPLSGWRMSLSNPLTMRMAEQPLSYRHRVLALPIFKTTVKPVNVQ